MKPWKVASQKTKSPANIARIPHPLAAFLIVAVLVSLSCSQSYSNGKLSSTATPQEVAAVPVQATQVAPAATLAQPVQPEPTLPPPGPTITPQPSATATQRPTPESPILYYTQAGDTLRGVAARFNVNPEEITSPQSIPAEGLFDPGVLLLIPPRLGETSSSTKLVPDSEIVYSPSALDFDIEAFVQSTDGYLKTYTQWTGLGNQTGASIVQRVATENSINPRLLLALLEQQSRWVHGQPNTMVESDYPMGWMKGKKDMSKLFAQLNWAVSQLNWGYYGWRDGRVTELEFPNGVKMRLNPELNAGSVAVMYVFSRLYDQAEWAGVLYGPEGFSGLYERMFGNPWLRAQGIEPLFPATLTQPPLELPYRPGRTWSFTGGPHSAWQKADGVRAALDFAPTTTQHGCYESTEWATAVSAGLVIRSERGVVVLDLDGDGHEQTGWTILYLHMATQDRAPVGTWLNLNDPVGHPSCEGGVSTGTHLHIARKYNGEWILADGPMPFTLSGWRTHADPEEYHGWLTQGDLVVTSSLVGSHESLVTRP